MGEACKNDGQFDSIAEQQRHQHKRRAEHRDEKNTAAEDPNCGDAVVGHEQARRHYTVLYNAPEHVWQFLEKRA